MELLELKEPKKLKSYLNSNLDAALYSIYENDLQSKKCIEFKKEFIKDNFKKDYNELLSIIQDSSSDQYYNNLVLMLIAHNLSEENFHYELEKINEKSNKQKDNGVYYTPEDVSEFIIYNCIYQIILHNLGIEYVPCDVSTIKTKIDSLLTSEVRDLIINLKVLDPTCGTGAFLVKVFECKMNLVKHEVTDDEVYRIIDSIHGNDIDLYSTYISKTRLLFKSMNLRESLNIDIIYKCLEKNFYNLNFITSFAELNDKYDIILGNPPYVEKSKVEYAKLVKFGNLYADVIKNSIELLSENGVMGYIIPISYISTSRMSGIRKFVQDNTVCQYVLNYADRPDCLFIKVHQKLNILMAKKGQGEHKVYTSDYNFWYKSERGNLFKNNNFLINQYVTENYYPKLCSNLELSIYSKVHNNISTLITKQSKEGGSLYVNKRATFWIKSFVEPPYKSKEYSVLNYEDIHFINCILNSSLYWWYWIKVSDCWHITNKELSNFYVPDINDKQKMCFEKLSIELNNLLEQTKVKIDSKQSMYEYKHRFCKFHIDLIDEELAKIYNLTDEELNYIKNYQLYYRTSGDQGEKK